MKTLIIFLTTVLMAGILLAAEPTGIVAHWTMNISPLPSDGLVAYWALDDNTTDTDVVDSAGSNTGTFGDAGGNPNTAAHSTTGNIQTALTFDGGDDLITVPADTSIDVYGKTALTITAWINPASDGEGNVGRILTKALVTTGYLFNVRNEAASAVGLRVAIFHDGAADMNVEIDAGIPLNGWTHVGFVYNEDSDKKGKIYLNAILQSLDTDTAGVGTIDNDSALDLILGNSSDGARTFDGLIDDVRIYSRALSPSEISNLYNATTVRDSRGTNNGTYADAAGNLNAYEYTTAGVINLALTFDDVDDYIDTGATFQSTFQDSFSISMWAKPNDGIPAIGSEDFIGVADRTGDDSVFAFVIGTGGELAFVYTSEGNSGNSALTGAVLSDGVQDWIHFVVVADSTVGGVGGKKIYMNGIEQTLSAANGSTSGVTFGDFTSAENLIIGGTNNDGTPSSFFNGSIDNVMIFDRALSLRDIQTLYRNGNGTENVADLDRQRRIRRGINRF